MHKKGNISLLVLFILVACSLLGLLTVHFLKNMFTQYSQITAYYKTYYLAQAGIETALTQLKYRGLGFSERIGSGHSLVADNIKQPQSSLDFEVVGSSHFLSKSLNDSGACVTPFILNPKQSLILPLFKDGFVGGIRKSLSAPLLNINLGNTLKLLTPVNGGALVNLGLVIADSGGLYGTGIYFSKGDMSDKNFLSKFYTLASSGLISLGNDLEDSRLQNWQSDSDFSPYLVLVNTDSIPASFCLTLPPTSSLPTQQYLIKSFGSYGMTKLGLEATYKQALPAFLIDSTLGM